MLVIGSHYFSIMSKISIKYYIYIFYQNLMEKQNIPIFVSLYLESTIWKYVNEKIWKF